MQQDPDDYVINVSNLSKRFGDKQAVIDSSLQVKRGEIFGFLGPNGSGKTTTLRMICGLMQPDGGTGTCLGYNVLTQSDQIKLHVGYMTQSFTLYADLSILQNLDFIARLYGVKQRHKAVQESIEQLGLWDRRHQLAGNLSGGWRQRLALSAALIHRPDVLLLDEPTAGVDPQARRDFWQHVQMMAAQGMTALVTTHYMDEAVRCNKISYIVYGKTVITGTADEIIKESGLVTWRVTGDHLDQYAQQLRKMPGVDQVAAFGSDIHVSGKNKSLLDKTVAECKTNEQTQWSEISSSLEDVFILMVEQNKDERHEI